MRNKKAKQLKRLAEILVIDGFVEDRWYKWAKVYYRNKPLPQEYLDTLHTEKMKKYDEVVYA